MPPLRIADVKAFAVRVPSRHDPYAGTAGLTGEVDSDATYRRVKPYRALYSTHVETVLVRLAADSGLIGWGECQAAVGGRAVQAIVEDLLEPLLVGRDAREGTVLWSEMYDSMRDRGHGGGFMLDAIAGVDMALWDLRGKHYGEPVSRLLGGAFAESLPLYLSGPRGATIEQRLDDAARFVGIGFGAVKLFIGKGIEADLDEVRRFRERLGERVELLVDAQWLYSPPEALALGRGLEQLGVGFLETPINPEDVAGHGELARALRLPIALGETERTRWQIGPFLAARGVDVVQPDVGRCGITEAHRIALQAEYHNLAVAFHSGVGFGPYIAATIQTAAATPNLIYVEYQPQMHAHAERLYGRSFAVEGGRILVDSAPGLCIGAPRPELLSRHYSQRRAEAPG